MPKFYNKDMAELAHQLTLSPRRLRVAQIQEMEAVLRLTDPNRSYPFDFVCYRITKYRKRGPKTSAFVPGKALISDLVTMAEVCSRKANLRIEELCDRMTGDTGPLGSSREWLSGCESLRTGNRKRGDR